jgi:hypothetical protein
MQEEQKAGPLNRVVSAGQTDNTSVRQGVEGRCRGARHTFLHSLNRQGVWQANKLIHAVIKP